jgi:hypothetical protein
MANKSLRLRPVTLRHLGAHSIQQRLPVADARRGRSYRLARYARYARTSDVGSDCRGRWPERTLRARVAWRDGHRPNHRVRPGDPHVLAASGTCRIAGARRWSRPPRGAGAVVAMLGQAESAIVDVFRKGGGIDYRALGCTGCPGLAATYPIIAPVAPAIARGAYEADTRPIDACGFLFRYLRRPSRRRNRAALL